MKTTIFFALLLALTGCNLKSGGGGNQNGGDTELTGTFTVRCVPVANNDFLTHTWVFGAGDVTSLEQHFFDSFCGTALYTIENKGTYTILGSSSAATGAKELDVAFTEKYYTPNSTSGANYLNTIGACGLNNWTTGVEVDCSALAASLYQIYQLATTNLTFGNTSGANNGSSATTRPRTIDPLRIFLRIN